MKKLLFWLLAFIITAGTAFFQRMTGPTYPLRKNVSIDGLEFRLRLPRSALTTTDLEIKIGVPEPLVGYIEYRRHKTLDAWTTVKLNRFDDKLIGQLPKQPSAGKLLYKVYLLSKYGPILVSGQEPVTVRFRDPVSPWLLVAHVITIFAGMLAATAAGLAALDKRKDPANLVKWALVFIFIGGFVFGPLVQKAAFGVYWSGFPLGKDLTDNKTLVSFILWVAAFLATRKGKSARGLVLAAAVMTLIVYLIPHSLLGSELDYSNLDSSAYLMPRAWINSLALPFTDG